MDHPHESSLSAVANVPPSGFPLVDSCSGLEASLFTVANVSSSGFPLVLSSSSSFIFHLSSDSVALPFGFNGPSRDVSSSHKDQTLASNVIEESREFGAILQLTDSDQGSSVVSSATPPDSSEWGRPLSSSLKWGAS